MANEVNQGAPGKEGPWDVAGTVVIVGPVTIVDPAEGPIGAAVPVDGIQIGGRDPSGNLRSPAVRPSNPANTDQGIVARTIDQNATSYQQTAIAVGVAQTALSGALSATRTTLVVSNLGPNTIYVGKTGVTTASGAPIDALTGRKAYIDIDPGVVLFAICGVAQVSPADTRIEEMV